MQTIIVFLSLLLAGSVLASDGMAGDLHVKQVWSRAMPPVSRTGAVYLTISNTGTAPDRLLSASASVSDRAELHTHIHEGGMMKMRKVDAVELPAGEDKMFQPGGLHIMLMGLNTPLVEGQTFSLTLRFEQAGETSVEVPIAEAGARTLHGGMKHDGMKKKHKQ